MRKKSADSLIHALRMGDEIRADGVVLHPGSTVGEPQDEALARVGEMLKHALAESEGCRLLLENTAGAGNTLGRSFEELRDLIDLAGGDKRIGVCLDSLPHVRDRLRHHDGGQARRGGRRTSRRRSASAASRCLHVNDSMTPLGSNRDRHATPGQGEIGETGCAAFLSEPAFEKLPALFEGPGTSGHAPDKVDVDTMKKLRKKGLRAQAARQRSSSGPRCRRCSSPTRTGSTRSGCCASHWLTGRLTADEFEERVGEACAARYSTDLWRALRWLPVESAVADARQRRGLADPERARVVPHALHVRLRLPARAAVLRRGLGRRSRGAPVVAGRLWRGGAGEVLGIMGTLASILFIAGCAAIVASV